MEQECLRLFHYLIKDVIFSRQFDDAEELIRAYEMIANDSWIQDQKKSPSRKSAKCINWDK